MQEINKKGLWWWVHKTTESSQYRQLVYNKMPVSLCSWFWSGLLVMALMAVVSVAAVVMACALLILTVNMVVYLSGPFTGVWWDGDVGHSFTIVVLAFLTAVSVTAYFNDHIDFAPNYMKKPLYKLFNRVSPKDSKPKEPSVVMQYLKARKEKWCPMLTLRDDE